MSDENPTPTGDAESKRGPGLGRRSLLATLGVGGSLALAGCTSSASSGGQTGGEGEVDPRFGYVGTSKDESPPVEPDHTVQLLIKELEGAPIPQFYFEPTGLYVEPGDTVTFELGTPHHNINAFHPAFGYEQRVPDGVPPFSSPILAGGDYWLYTFEEEGVHDIACAPHEIFGMVGRVVVGSASGPGASPVGEAPGGERARPPEFTAALVLSDPAMSAENIVENEAVSWDDLAPESKKPLLKPVGGSE